jgi:putative phage-type endonuclease
MIDILKEDIASLVDDFNRESSSSTLEEMTVHVIQMLIEIGYDKKKHLFDRFIRQVIAQHNIDLYGMHYNDFILEDKPEIVEYLGTLPQYEQRSPEWYAARKNSLGASESSTIFKLNPYESENKLILKKCGVVNPDDMRRMKVVCEHGIKYEAVIQDMYCRDKNTSIIEFGSLRHSDEALSIVTASPDGITPNGCMLEIKAPAKRLITGIPPSYYWVQCQQQMQVCKLDKVDFLEVKIAEYTNKEDYMNDNLGGDTNTPSTSQGLDKNVVIEYHKLDSESELGYIYPDKLLNTDEIKEWRDSVENSLQKSDNKQYRRTSYWKCEQYCLTEIYKDQEWWTANVHKFGEFWKKVEYYRENGHNDLLPKKRKAYIPKPAVCFITSDDDDEPASNQVNYTTKPIIKSSITISTEDCMILSDDEG